MLRIVTVIAVAATLATAPAAIAGGYETCPKGMHPNSTGDYCQTPNGKHRAQLIMHSVPSRPSSHSEANLIAGIIFGLVGVAVIFCYAKGLSNIKRPPNQHNTNRRSSC
jgi:hypothetical protein